MELMLGANEYSISKLNAIQQFHVARKIAPMLWAMGKEALSGFQDSEIDGIAALKASADVLSQMSDQDSEYILKTCLTACRRRSGAGWAKVQADNGQMMFDDIDLPVILQLAFNVIRENLGNFLSALPQA